MKKYLLLLIILFFSFNSFAQIEGNTKAKLYFFEAKKLFNQNEGSGTQLAFITWNE